ncbi:hypothetical protein AMECASPLE_019088 [Ameca splendens]|uniref:Uncharacterized protein n=1 Tax=Ameca splendens TaxID=208324 RepID=A0ABV0XRW2_9TELE
MNTESKSWEWQGNAVPSLFSPRASICSFSSLRANLQPCQSAGSNGIPVVKQTNNNNKKTKQEGRQIEA